MYQLFILKSFVCYDGRSTSIYRVEEVEEVFVDIIKGLLVLIASRFHFDHLVHNRLIINGSRMDSGRFVLSLHVAQPCSHPLSIDRIVSSPCLFLVLKIIHHFCFCLMSSFNRQALQVSSHRLVVRVRMYFECGPCVSRLNRRPY